MSDEEGGLVPRMSWASRMIMCDEEVNMNVEDVNMSVEDGLGDEDAVGDEDGMGDDVNWEDGNLFVKSMKIVNESMTLELSRR